VDELLEWKADVRIGDYGYRTALHLAAFRGLSSLVTRLYAPEIVDQQTLRGNSALHAAVDANQLETAKTLLSMGIDPYLKNVQGREAIDLTNKEEYRELIEGK
jgi:ankyrin repeat protein